MLVWVLSFDDKGSVCYGDPPYNGVLGVFSSLEKAEAEKSRLIGTPMRPEFPAWSATVFRDDWFSIDELQIDGVKNGG